MNVYQAPDVKDRVATGDDLYVITDEGTKKKLTPSPTTVEEPGTEINRALLVPLMEALREATEALVPYDDYWWRIRQTSGSYSLRLAPAGSISGAYRTFSSSSFSYYGMVVITFSRSATSTNPEYTGSVTLQYSSNITMSSSGVISLVNPSTLTVNASTISSYASTLNGKYVKGLDSNEDIIYKINASTIINWQERWAYGDETETYTYYGYGLYDATSTAAQVAVANHSTTASDYTYVHNSDPDFYPHSGTTAGTEYQYLGKIHDVAAADAPFSLKTVNITSASWNGNKQYTVTTKCKRYLLWGRGTTSVYGSAVLVDGTKGYGVRAYDRDASILVGAATVPVGSATVTFTSTGFRLSHSESTGPALTLAYLPLA